MRGRSERREVERGVRGRARLKSDLGFPTSVKEAKRGVTCENGEGRRGGPIWSVREEIGERERERES